MKFSIKTLVLAVALAASATGASAALNNGSSGNGELFLNVWDGAGSYTFDLNTTIDAFQLSVAAAGSINQSYALSGFDTFLSGVADTSALKFNLLAADGNGARRLLTTFTSPIPTTTKANDIIRSTVGNVGGFASVASSAMGTKDYDIVDSSKVAYAGKVAMGNRINNFLNFDTFAKLSSNSYDSGLSFMRIDALGTGTALSTYTQFMDNGNAVKVYIDAANTLHIAAVPEPESYAMLLAGLGMIGLMARRRLNKNA